VLYNISLYIDLIAYLMFTTETKHIMAILEVRTDRFETREVRARHREINVKSERSRYIENLAFLES